MLTAAGVTGAFGAIYAAHALYAFIDARTAFPVLGFVALAAIAAALVHGPGLAGLGLVGALATPLLVSSAQPNPWPVVVYLAVVVSAAYALARLRRWLWLAAAAATGAGLWTLPLDANGPGHRHRRRLCLPRRAGGARGPRLRHPATSRRKR